MSKGKILVAEDTATYRAILGDGLAARGYDVIYASDGLEAVRMAKEELPHLKIIVLDLLMPKMLGFDVLREIRGMEGGEKLPVMVITGLFKNLEDIKRIKELGASGFIDKALPIDEVVFRIDHLLNPDSRFTGESKLAPVSLLVNYKESDKPFSAYTYTVSKKGMFLRTTHPSPVDAQLQVQFALGEEGKTIECNARVVYCVTATDKTALLRSPQGMGIEFVGLGPAEQADIEAWVEKIAAEKNLTQPEKED